MVLKDPEPEKKEEPTKKTTRTGRPKKKKAAAVAAEAADPPPKRGLSADAASTEEAATRRKNDAFRRVVETKVASLNAFKKGLGPQQPTPPVTCLVTSPSDENLDKHVTFETKEGDEPLVVEEE